ncbi:hypothetical protein APR41_10025 [Salegentibacter salinarum]|uniref:Uncharacterized protein n=2 Tax=Salegentibacter salinarum TaxID=447422 RepID=A0A2N0TN13_9FLAO|nr:hypothetical protein APR41_10025 [Salegentibacter salinarum]SKB69107.1 hypothetical protein SAMN05660903_02101 [Salegentibacter salinarum]
MNQLSRNKQWKDQRSKYLLTGSILGLVIAFSPYIFYLYEIFPSGPVWENSFFTYESKYYEDVLTVAWTYLGKIVPLILLFIWFFTCKHWWYHTILIPISMYSFQLVTIFYEDVYLEVNLMDTNQLIYLAPFFIIILSLVYLIRIKIFDRIYGIDLSEIDETDVSVFSPISESDRREVKSFQEEEEYWEPTQEEYYTRL